MKRLLLVSNSVQYGSGYLDHCANEMCAFLGTDVARVLFVPYASGTLDAYAASAAARFERMGYGLGSLHQAVDAVAAVRAAEAVFVGGGNTFRLLRGLYVSGVVDVLRDRVRDGMPYMGASAGSNVACPTIKTTNDMPIVEPPSFEALGLVPFNINPHYLDPDPESKHQGETREKRIAEFHEENDVPVVGLREGSMLRVEGGSVTLKGAAGGRLFRKGEAPIECHPGDALDYLMSHPGP